MKPPPTVAGDRTATPGPKVGVKVHGTIGRAETPPTTWITHRTPEYQRAGTALFLAGFASFSLLYCVQPLLPAFATAFSITPAESSLALSLTTGPLAFSIVIAGAYSQALGRRGLMFGSMAMAAILNIIAGLTPDWHGLLAARALEGLVLGGVPAVAMAWLAEEIDPHHLGKTMGLYIAGTAFGAMMGRVGMGLLTEFTSWRLAMVTLGALCLVSAIGFFVLLPRSRNFVARRGLSPAYHLAAWAAHLRNGALVRLYAVGFLLTAIFVTLFNYATFRLSALPYGLSQMQLSMIFLAFAFGIVSSSVAGSLVGRFDRRPLLIIGFVLMFVGVLLTLAAPLPIIILGTILVATGFFIGHAVASSSVGRLAGMSKGHAASLYLLFYYLGSSIVGSMGGWVWQHGGWTSIVVLTGGLALTAILLVLAPTRSEGGQA